ncbi:Imm27 family immunity protein [Flagellimonas algicola]|uniref:Immunity protein 27 of polymorphic toxin system n=1 Tax=Flagellimonas algicola TaxID=2583815 RepID=A0ABY2WKJ9_9FLAO|nr:Imm27 family immunity protein [Allomuricauda algicola]TMU55096.1 hypothetical protein FGG15_13000 [Allomuricauda algicola]
MKLNIENLKKVASDDTGWNTLYLDEEQQIYWEKTYQNSEIHGGGSPMFLQIELTSTIMEKYNLHKSNI